MRNKENIDSYLLRYLLNELKGDERLEVEKWINSGENREYFREFYRSYVYLQWTMNDEVVLKSYRKFRRRLTRRYRLKVFAGIAASIVLLIGSGIWGYFSFSTGAYNAPVETIIQAGMSQAFLHLSSGKIIPIDTVSRMFEEQDGTSIEVCGNGSLNYRNDSVVKGRTELLNRLEVPRRGEFQLTLSDGTRAWVNSESELSYPSSFVGESRVVYLKGEAFFDVVHDDSRPFIVRVGDLDVKVYGTRFNVNTYREGVVETVLVHGRVGLNSAGKEIMLKPEQKGEYRSADREILVEKVDVLPYIAWHEGNFVFKNESLELIMNKLMLWYDLHVEYKDEEVKKVRLSGIMERYKDVNELFHFFEKTSNLVFVLRNNTVYITEQKE